MRRGTLGASACRPSRRPWLRLLLGSPSLLGREARPEGVAPGLLSEIRAARVGERAHLLPRRNGMAAAAAAETPERHGLAVGALEGNGDPPRQVEHLSGAARRARDARIVDDQLGTAFA